MFELKWRILVLSVFIFIAEFHGGETLKCIVCKSTDNENCANAPTEIETSECQTTTAAPPAITTTTAASPATTTTTAAPPATTTTTAAPPATTTTVAPPATTTTTVAPPATTTTTVAPPATTTTTVAPPATTTTAAPPATTTTAAPPATTTTAAPPATTTTAAPPATTTTTAAPPATTTTTVAPPATTTTTAVPPVTAAPAPPANNTGGSNGTNLDSQINKNIPLAIQINRRSRRHVGASVFAESNFQCYKIVYQESDKEVVERGCIPETSSTCDILKEGKGDVSVCDVCNNEDGCNSSSMIINNIALMLLLLGINFHLTR